MHEVVSVHPAETFRWERERKAVAISTVTWWLDAHTRNTTYHRQFPGYCLWCQRQREERPS